MAYRRFTPALLVMLALFLGFCGQPRPPAASETAPPDASSSPAPTPAEQSLTLQPGEVAIEYIAHACFRLHSADGTRLLIDPYASRIWLGYDFPKALAMDAVLITHPHYDHDAGDRMGKPLPWPSEVPVYRAPEQHQIGSFSIQGIEGKHADPYGKEFGQINTIWVVEAAGLRIAHLGDNGPLTAANIAALGEIDVLMLPIDADYHILAQATIQAIRDAIQPRVLIPMHYQLPDLEPGPDSPEDLGPIDPWLTNEPRVLRLERHIEVFTKETLPDEAHVYVFPHSPAVVLPQPDEG